MRDAIQGGLCQECSGFLFRHRCDRFAKTVCGRCSKPICNEHRHYLQDGVVCTGCARQAVCGTDLANVPSRRSGTNADSMLDDPFLDGPNWYIGFGGNFGCPKSLYPLPTAQVPPGNDLASFDDLVIAETVSPTDGEALNSSRSADTPMASEYDPADFTEGDAASFAEECDECFEIDMSES